LIEARQEGYIFVKGDYHECQKLLLAERQQFPHGSDPGIGPWRYLEEEIFHAELASSSVTMLLEHDRP
jgi:hypothetical protein